MKHYKSIYLIHKDKDKKVVNRGTITNLTNHKGKRFLKEEENFSEYKSQEPWEAARLM